MKKFRSLIYVFALALIFAGVTKASASDVQDPPAETYKITWEVPGEGCTVAVVAGEDTAVTSGTTEIAAGTEITVTLTVTDGFTATVASDDAELQKAEDVYTFTMPENDVALTITATADSTGNENQGNENQGNENQGGQTGITAAVDYDEERIDVTSAKQVFFQIVKEAETTEAKAANWIKAAANGDGKYAIDFSATSNAKDAFYALTDDATKGDVKEVVSIDAVIKSAKITLNYKAETLTGKGLYDIIGGFEVKGVDKADDKKWDPTKDAALDTLYTLNWKRGANGTWAAASAFNQLNWDMVKASNSTLYINVSAQGSKAFRPSKETKLKVPKAAKAPTVKVDYVKGTVALKNGMQVRVNENTAWVDVLAYDKTKTDKKDIFNLATANEVTSTKVSSVAVADFVTKVEALLDDDFAAGEELTLEVRTAATTKKFPSNSGFVKVVLPKAAPTVKNAAVAVSYTEASKEPKVEAAYELDFTALFTKDTDAKYSDYEYVFVKTKGDKLNLTKQKWTKLTESGKVDLAKSIGKVYKYYMEGESKTATEVNYEAIDAIYIRLAAVKGTKEVTGVFASDYGIIDVTVSKAAAETPGEEDPTATEYTLTSDTKNPAAATFKVADAAATKAAEGATVEIVYTPTTGKQIASVSYTVEGSDTPVAVTATEGKYTFKMPKGNVTVTITEEDAPAQAEEYTVTFVAEAEGATVAVQVDGEDADLTDGALEAAEGAVITFTYTAADPTATVAVMNAEEALTAEGGVYTVTVAKADITITITETAAAAE